MSTLRRLFGASSRPDTTADEAGPEPRFRRGLAARMVVASVALALIVGAAFAVLLLAVNDLRRSGRQLTHSREANAAADRLEEHLIDLETGLRGFVIARQERFLEPWPAARAAIPADASKLESLAESPEQKRLARKIAGAIDSYVNDYAAPLVAAARRNDAASRSIAATDEGKRRVDALRLEFDRFKTVQRALLANRQETDDRNAGRAVTAATVGLAGSVVLILFFGGYLAAAIVRPLRRASRLAGQVAAGDLSTRIPERGVAEIGALERSFNTMATSLEAERVELRRLADRQAALRRVATLVARGVSSGQIFAAVTREIALLTGADLARIERYEPDGTVRGVAGWSRHEEQLAVGTRFALEGPSIAAQVLEKLRPVRVDSFADAPGPIAEEARQVGIRSSVGCPIVVEGRLWGVVAASSRTDVAFPPETESEMSEFTELVATAIANAESQAELRASRARIVAASDLTRRRIERDLHDGVQQRLVSLALTLRVAAADIPPDLDGLKDDLAEIASGLKGVLEDLREVSRGIHPAILAEGGLKQALTTVARRSPVPVEVDVRLEGRLPQPVEVAAYYIVAEALTNAAKHAQASRVNVSVDVRDGTLHVAVRDDGLGGADTVGGSGLVGLKDRAEALGGTMSLRSPHGGGTALEVELPARL